MEWTTSAAGRGSFADLQIARTLGRTPVNALVSLGKGDAVRGAMIALAGVLTITAAALPLLPRDLIAALMFVSGAAIALTIAGRPASETSNPLEAVKSPTAAPIERRLTPAPTLFAELFSRADTPTLADRAALARLTAQMSHELRTPLNAVLGFSEIMANEVCGPLGSSCYAGYARDIHASGRTLLKISEDALAITSLLTAGDRRHQPQTSCLAGMISDALAFHAPDLDRRGVQIELRGNASQTILAEPQTVRQLIVNLIADRIADADAGSLLVLETRSHDESIDVSISLTASSGRSITPHADTFALTLARTLAELSGSPLVETTSNSGTQSLKLSFASALQNDFFASEGH